MRKTPALVRKLHETDGPLMRGPRSGKPNDAPWSDGARSPRTRRGGAALRPSETSTDQPRKPASFRILPAAHDTRPGARRNVQDREQGQIGACERSCNMTKCS